MFKAIGKVLLIALLLIILPMCLVMLSILGVFAPFIGFLILMLFPFILIGIIIGYRSGKKKKQQQGAA